MGRWKMVLSNTLCAEYEEVLNAGRTRARYGLCAVAERRRLKSPRLPVLSDPDDESQVHPAFEADVRCIVILNVKHLNPARQLGMAVLTPKEFLKIARE